MPRTLSLGSSETDTLAFEVRKVEAERYRDALNNCLDVTSEPQLNIIYLTNKDPSEKGYVTVRRKGVDCDRVIVCDRGRVQM
jgi:hypothetical protein